MIHGSESHEILPHDSAATIVRAPAGKCLRPKTHRVSADKFRGVSSRLKTGKVSIGILFVLLSSIVFAPTSQTATKYLAGDFPLFQIMFFRSLGQTAWMLLFFWPRHGIGVFRSNRPGLQITRSALLFLSSICWISAVAVVPLTTASAINFTAPVFIVILSIPILGERVGLHRWSAVLVGFVGALVVIQPGSGGLHVEVALLLVAAFLFSLYQIFTRMAAATDTEATSSIYTVLVALVVSAMLLPWNYVPPNSGDTLVWLAFLATGLLGGIRHYFVVRAYTYAPASVISPFFYCELIGVTLLGFLVFGDVPQSSTWLGAGIIVCSGLYIAHRERIRVR
ncbi:MAG: drug/metabolite transporter (DMT)-like permease [Gammaproteobacteria bacterium]